MERLFPHGMTLSPAVFSPTQGTIRLVFRRDGSQEELKNWALPFDWSFAELYDAHGEEVGFVWDSVLDYDVAGQVSVTYSIMPPAKWPEQLILAIPNQGGTTGIQKIVLELSRNKPG